MLRAAAYTAVPSHYGACALKPCGRRLERSQKWAAARSSAPIAAAACHASFRARHTRASVAGWTVWHRHRPDGASPRSAPPEPAQRAGATHTGRGRVISARWALASGAPAGVASRGKHRSSARPELPQRCAQRRRAPPRRVGSHIRGARRGVGSAAAVAVQLAPPRCPAAVRWPQPRRASPAVAAARCQPVFAAAARSARLGAALRCVGGSSAPSLRNSGFSARATVLPCALRLTTRPVPAFPRARRLCEAPRGPAPDAPRARRRQCSGKRQPAQAVAACAPPARCGLSPRRGPRAALIYAAGVSGARQPGAATRVRARGPLPVGLDKQSAWDGFPAACRAAWASGVGPARC